jgi:hypothetical protein
MKIISNPYLNQLDGYLKCLSRLCANRYSFGVTSYEAIGDIDSLVYELVNLWGQGDEYIEKSEYQYKGKEIIDYQQLCKEVEKYIFNGLLNRKDMTSDDARNYATRMLIEDINEYYGLVSTTINENGVFHPLIRSEVYRLDIQNKKYEKAFFYIVKIENIYVLTNFCKNVITEK